MIVNTFKIRRRSLDDCADIIFYLLCRRRIIEVKLVTKNRQTLNNLLERKIILARRRERNGEPNVDQRWPMNRVSNVMPDVLSTLTLREPLSCQGTKGQTAKQSQLPNHAQGSPCVTIIHNLEYGSGEYVCVSSLLFELQ